MRRFFPIPTCVLACGLMLGPAPASRVFAQDDDTTGGIAIDAEGVVRPAFSRNRASALSQRQKEAFAEEHLAGDVRAFNAVRKVSLPRLERAFAALGVGADIPDDMRYLAGLQRIDYILVYPEGKDVVLAGPAEGFAPGAENRMLGLTTDRPPIQIDDLLVALQAALRSNRSIGCSIDPDAERLAALQQYVAQNSSPTTSAAAKGRYARMARILGLEDVSIYGVPDDSHFARTLVDADYRMKRIALGTAPSGIREVRSHLSLLVPNGNSMQRWWFVPFYDAIYANDDGTAFQLAGQRVQLMAQEEWVGARGDRFDAAFTRASTERFAQLFTQHYEKLAGATPVFAELQNLFDLAVVCALLRKEQVLERVGWRADVFLDAQRAAIDSYPVPRSVPSEATTRPVRNGTMLGLIGGVTLDPAAVVATSRVDVPGEARQATNVREHGAAPADDAVRWWWD